MPPQRGKPGAVQAPVPPEQSAFRAMEILEKCLHKVERENTLRDLVSMDLRSIMALRQRYTDKPRDPDNYKWLRQLTVVWSTRLSGLEHSTFRELFRLVEKCGRPG